MLNTHRSRIRCFAPTIAMLAFVFSSVAFGQHFQQTDLVTDSKSISSTATIDPNLVNAWGLTRGSGSPWWVSDNGTGLSTLYDGAGAIVPLVVTIPPPMGGAPPSAPTGVVFNYSRAFAVAPGDPSAFIFVTEDGTIAGWNPKFNLNSAVIKVDNSKQGAIYKGCAIAKEHSIVRLYASNFASGQVEMYDAKFQPVMIAGAFTDPNL